MNGNTIYHLEFKAGGHHYFGSITAIYSVFEPRDIGITKQSLWNYKITPDKPYENKICIIRKGQSTRNKQTNI